MRRCESCGKVFPESKDVFCPHCGAIATSKQVCGCEDSSNMARYTRANNGQPVNSAPYGNNVPHNDHAPASYTPTVQAQPRQPAKVPVNEQKKRVAVIFAIVFVLFCVYAVINSLSESDFDIDSYVEDFADDADYDTGDYERFYAFGSVSDTRQTVAAPKATVQFKDDRLLLFTGDLCDPDTNEPVLPYDDISDIALLWYRAEEGEAYLPDEYGFMRYCDINYDGAFAFQYIDVPDDGSFCCFSNVEAVTYEDGYYDCSHFEVQLPFDAVTVDNGTVRYWIADVADDNTVTFHPFIHA